MQANSNRRPRSPTNGPESTYLKCVDSVRDSGHGSSYSNSSTHNNYLGEDSVNNLENVKSSRNPRYSFSSSSGAESSGDTELTSFSNTYENTSSQKRELPPIPDETSPPQRSPTPTSCTYCGFSGHSSEQKSSNYIQRRYLICIALVSMVFSMASLGVAGVSFKLNNPWAESTSKEGDYEICLPCDELADDDGSREELKGRLVPKFEDGVKELCCARTSGQMSALLQLIINQQKSVNVVKAPPLAGKFRFSPVSAHKYLHPWSDKEPVEVKSEEPYHHLKLSPNMNYTMQHTRHVTAKDNFLQIPYRGLYFIYSSVFFKPSYGGPCGQLRHQTWGHYIKRHSPSRISSSGTLVQSAHTCCESCKEDHHTSYAAGVFLLEAGDSISVDVSGSGVVAFEGDGTYLGLVMLGSWEPKDNKDVVNANKG